MPKIQKTNVKLQPGEALVVASADDLLHIASIFETLSTYTDIYSEEDRQIWLDTAKHFRKWVSNTVNYENEEDDFD